MKRIIISIILILGVLTIVGVTYAQQLDKKTQQALTDAINDEYKARAIYQKVIDTFGAVKPFANIIKAEETHIGELKPLFKKYGIEVPKDEWYKQVPGFATEREACATAVQAEIDNAKMYDGFLTFVKEQDIVAVFKRLRSASQDNHLPAFQRCAGGTGQGQGRGKGRYSEQGVILEGWKWQHYCTSRFWTGKGGSCLVHNFPCSMKVLKGKKRDMNAPRGQSLVESLGLFHVGQISDSRVCEAKSKPSQEGVWLQDRVTNPSCRLSNPSWTTLFWL